MQIYIPDHQNVKTEKIISFAFWAYPIRFYFQCLSTIPTIFYFINQDTLSRIKEKSDGLELASFNIQQNNIDYVIVVGGDGSILYTVKQFCQSSPPPIISFQNGTLGFMCQFNLSQIKLVIQKLVESRQINKTHHYYFLVKKVARISCCMRKIKQSTENKSQGNLQKLCVNQAYISRVVCGRITLEVYINDEFITQTTGDGLLISTPTGSTAYSLSAGGPILEEGVNCILIVPIAPNSLSFRPICITSDKVIKIRLSQKSRAQAMSNFDGQFTSPFTLEDELIIRKSKYDLELLTPKGDLKQMPSWLQRLNHFLGWNETFKTPQCQRKFSHKKNGSEQKKESNSVLKKQIKKF